MAITRNPKNANSTVIKDSKAEAFIAGADKVTTKPVRENKKPILIRFDSNLLKRIDDLARHRGINRSACIQYIISKAIDDGNV